MNFMKKLVGKRSTSDNASRDRTLALHHLRRLFLEYLHPTKPSPSKEEHESKLYFMLPLFIKIFADSDPHEMVDRFGDVLQFAGHLSNLMVCEMQARAANKTKENASIELVRFLIDTDTEQHNHGFNLLCVMSILATGSQQIIECMTATTLPSTLSKGLRLFFLLPAKAASEDKIHGVQSLYVPMLVRLCHYMVTTNELMQTNELAALFDSLTQSCNSEHMIWRTAVSEVVTAVTRHCLNDELIDYLYAKKCISLSIANIEQMKNTDPLAVVEMFVTLICVLKDSAEVSDVLLENFGKARGYKFLRELLIEYSETHEDAARNLATVVSSFVLTGYKEIELKEITASPFQSPGSKQPLSHKPSGAVMAVKNLEAFKVIVDVFLKCDNENLGQYILKSIQSIFNSDPKNYFILDTIHPLTLLIERSPHKSHKVQKQIFQLVEFVAFQLHWVPSEELVTMGILFKNDSYQSCQAVAMETFIHLITQEERYKDIFRDIGLLEILTASLKNYSSMLRDKAEAESVQTNKVIQSDDEEEAHSQAVYIFFLIEAIRLLIESNNANSSLFRQCGGARCVHNLIPFDVARPHAIRVIQQLIVDGGNDDLGTILGLMHSTPETEVALKKDVLNSLLRMFTMNNVTRKVFQEVGGFIYVVSVLVSLEGSLSNDPSDSWKKVLPDNILELVWIIFQVLVVAMQDEPLNKVVFMDEVRFRGLTETLRLLGCFQSLLHEVPPCSEPFQESQNASASFLTRISDEQIKLMLDDKVKFIQFTIVRCLFNMALGINEIWESNDKHRYHLLPQNSKAVKVIHAGAVSAIIDLLPALCDVWTDGDVYFNEISTDLLMYVVDQLLILLSSEQNQQIMCESGLPSLLLRKCQHVFFDECHPLNSPITKLFERLASQSITPNVFRAFLRLGSPLCSKSPYALLRTHSKNLSRSISKSKKTSVDGSATLERRRSHSLSFRILDGDLKLGDVKQKTPDINKFTEENELHSDDDEEEVSEDGANDEGIDDLIDVTSGLTTTPDAVSIGSTGDGKNDEAKYYDSDLDEANFQSLGRESSVESKEYDEKPPTDDHSEITDTVANGDNDITPNTLSEWTSPSKLKDLSKFHNLNHKNLIHHTPSNAIEKYEGKQLPQNLIKCLVSISTPKDLLVSDSYVSCPFTEFDMSQDGFSALVIPSLLSLRSTSGGVVAGTVERAFPPPVGITYSAWISVQKISTSIYNPLRLLTLQRKSNEAVSDAAHCSHIFTLAMDLKHKELVVNTEENENMFTLEDKPHKNANEARINCENILKEDQWFHLCVVLSRSVLKTSSLAVYGNGQLLRIAKIRYIHTGLPPGIELSSNRIVGCIGTHPANCHISNLVWRLGPMFLFEEPLSADLIKKIHQLGPCYSGSFQAPTFNKYFQDDDGGTLSALVSEEKVLLALNASNTYSSTVSKIRNYHSSADAKAVGEELKLPFDDRHTPIHLMKNCATHLQGLPRGIGALLVGNAGIRTFAPFSAASACLSIGGIKVLLSMVAMSSNLDDLYASLKALTCVIQGSPKARREMMRIQGHEILAFLLKRKSHLLNTHILHLVFSLVGTVQSEQESVTIPNVTAFQEILCDLEMWHSAPSDLERSLYSHFYELVTQGSESATNIEQMRSLGLIPELLMVLHDTNITDSALNSISSIIAVLLCGNSQLTDVLRVGQFLASTLPDGQTIRWNEKTISDDGMPTLTESFGKLSFSKEMAHCIIVRNSLLDVILNTLHTAKDNSFVEMLYKILGFDWVLLFMSLQLHSSTVVRAVRILIKLIGSTTTALEQFYNGTGGGWMDDCDLLTAKRSITAAGFNLLTYNETNVDDEVNRDAFKIKGFPLLIAQLENHTDINEIYFLLFALLLGHPLTEIHPGLTLNMETLYLMFWPSTVTEGRAKPFNLYCCDASLVILHMIRVLMNKTPCPSTKPEQDSATVLLEFLKFLYQNVIGFSSFCHKKLFLQYLAATLFPFSNKDISTESSLEESLSPDLDQDLIVHPCCDTVYGFIKLICLDVLDFSPVKAKQIIENLLESYLADGLLNQQKEYQTAVLNCIIDAVLLGEVINSNITSNVMQNINMLAVAMGDKLWNGYFTKGYRSILSFHISSISSLDSSGKTNLDALYHSLYRIILYQFSRPQARITDHTTMLDFLYVLRSNSELIFSQRIKDTEFTASLAHWLFIVGSQEEISTDGSSSVDKDTKLKQNQNDWRSLLSGAVERVWSVFYYNKKQEIEEAFKQIPAPTFTSYGHDQAAVGSVGKVEFDLQAGRALYGDLAAKAWMSVISCEEKRKAEALGSQAVRAFEYLIRPSRSAVSRISLKIWKEKDTEDYFDTREILDCYNRHIHVIRCLDDYYYENHQQEVLLRAQQVGKRWMMMEEDLTRERALWGPENFNPLDKWMLDVTEGPCRMRKRLCKNDLFYMLYPPAPKDASSLPTKYKTPRSHDSDKILEACNRYLLADNQNSDSELERVDFSSISRSYALHDFDNETYMGEVSNQTLFQMLESGDKIYSMYRCARVRGLDSAEGLFLLGKNHFYIVDGFTLLSTERQSNSKHPSREIKEIESLPVGTHEPLIPDAKGNSVMRRTFSKWSYGDVREIHKRRYLLQDIALEIFSHNGSNNFLVFPTEVAKTKVYMRLQRASAMYLADAQESLVGMKADTNVETSGNLFSSFKGDKASVTSRWVRGEISNFQYLMHLNTLAGRSYNDLMQYPIFPWILADYESEELDLSDPSTFRNFSQPMGAQTSARLAQFEKRYAEWEDPTGETPAYHYGTHYSSAMIVASYLIRLEPFTQYFLRLQGGHFDLADRLFYSIKEAWLSASEANMTDIKELIPEFFYLPEFLVNNNNFDLGKKQNGMEIGHVHLPKWAKGDHKEFIRVHRKALECDYVSAHLHEWIDLVFGSKQQGPEAVEASNVFHHLFYKGSVDFKKIQEPVKRNATISFINNFGQMPKQIFSRPHPVKKAFRDLDSVGVLSQAVLGSVSVVDRYFTHHLASLVPSAQPVKELCSPVGHIVVGDKYHNATDKFKLLLLPLHNRYIAWGFGDFGLRYCSSDDKVLNVFEDVLIGQVECAACLSDDSFVTGGTSTVVSVWKLEKNKDKVQKLKLEKLLYGHQNTITCISVSLSYNLIVSGSEDCSCIIWDTRRLSYVRQLTDHNGTVNCIAINNLNGNIVTCSGTWMYVWSVNGDLIVKENTAAAMSAQILTCTISEVEEWDESSVILTGSSDGVVRIWGIDFVNPLHYERSNGNLYKKRLSHSEPDVNRIGKATDNNLRTSVTQQSVDGSDEYIFVSKSPPKQEETFAAAVWERKIALRHKFTMHTSFGRLDNVEPAAITSLAISKDHRKVYVGDARGRVYSWSVSDSVGRMADHWVKDEGAQTCSECHVKFTFSERRHHCRNCGNVFCGKCSRYEAPIAQLRIFKAVRVCKRCHLQLKISKS